MTAPLPPTFDALLQLCADAAPEPWYPARYAGDRAALDEPLIRLRLAGLVRLTDWQPGVGQGYVLTAAGSAALADTRSRARLRSGRLPAPRPERRERPARTSSGDDDGVPVVTNVLVAAMIAAFAVGAYSAHAAGMPLNKYLATGDSPLGLELLLNPAGIARGQWYRLLSYALVHAGGVHLLMNVVGHLVNGPMTERLYSRGRFVYLYLVAVFGSGLAALMTGRGVVGSSGGLCGIIGAEIAYVFVHRDRIQREVLREWRSHMVGVVVLITIVSMAPQVSWEGHLGGALAGFAAGLLLNLEREGRTATRWAALLGLIFLPLAGLGWVAGLGAALPTQVARREAADFLQRVAPAAQEAQRAGEDVIDDVAEPARDTKAADREPKRVETVLAELGGVRESAIAALNAARKWPYSSQHIEAARRQTAEALAGEIELLGLYEECFRRGTTWSYDHEGKLMAKRGEALELDIARRRATRAVAESP